jgi:hypothetical protein
MNLLRNMLLSMLGIFKRRFAAFHFRQQAVPLGSLAAVPFSEPFSEHASC